MKADFHTPETIGVNLLPRGTDHDRSLERLREWPWFALHSVGDTCRNRLEAIGIEGLVFARSEGRAPLVNDARNHVFSIEIRD